MHRYKLGKEILIESLLISKCDGFLYCNTNVSEFVKFLDNKKKIKLSSFKDLRLSSFFIISLIGVLLLIYKFPLGRYGTSYMVLIIVCLLYPLFYYLFNQSTPERIYKILFTFIVILSIVALAKNFKRIIINYEAGYNGAPWPRIYDHNFEIKGSSKKDNLPMKFNTINKNGIMFIATINKNLKSYIFAILGAEYILRWLPIGTHNWDKFLSPQDLEIITSKNNFLADETVGIKFNLLSKKWFKSNDTSVNYISTFLKN